MSKKTKNRSGNQFRIIMMLAIFALVLAFNYVVFRYYDLPKSAEAESITEPVEMSVVDLAVLPAEERFDFLFPEGAPSTPSQMEEYMDTIDVPVIDIEGKVGVKPIMVHEKIKDAVWECFREMKNAGYPVTEAYAYVWMRDRNTEGLSDHAYGVAIDINPTVDTPTAKAVGFLLH